jgi:hypothetical protein
VQEIQSIRAGSLPLLKFLVESGDNDQVATAPCSAVERHHPEGSVLAKEDIRSVVARVFLALRGKYLPEEQ